MGIFDKLFGTKTVTDVVDAVGDAVDKFVLTKQEKFDAEQKEKEQDWRFKQYEADNFQKEQDRLLQLAQLDALDRNNARELGKAELQSSDNFVRRFRYYLSAFIIMALFTMFGFIMFGNIPKDNIRFVDFLMGQLVTIVATIIAYYFGSSQGSANKAETINKQLDKQE